MMHYYQVLIADSRYHSDEPLTYSYESELPMLSVVSVPLRERSVSGFIIKKVTKPKFNTKLIKAVVSSTPLPPHCLELARWLSAYYGTTLADALRQFAPTRPVIRRGDPYLAAEPAQITLSGTLTDQQESALRAIDKIDSHTVLLHGETGSGKTRVYLEKAKQTLANGRSVILLTPEISLISQLAQAAKHFLNAPVLVLHSQLAGSERKKIWQRILEAKEPVVVVGPRSALFAPIKDPGLIVLDEAHEPAYKQDQSPRYQAARAASRLAAIVDSKVILGSATPLVSDYYLASEKRAVIRMDKPALPQKFKLKTVLVDARDRQNFGASSYFSSQMSAAINTTILAKKQVLIYLNRRGSARLILCTQCGWQLLCPNCDVPLVYHHDQHLARCHSCGFNDKPPVNCPSCGAADIIYRSAGTKTVAEELSKLFPQAKIRRFDSDNLPGERLNEVYTEVARGEVDILVGTQLLAKGLDLPRLGMVGVLSAESSMALPDFSAEERTFQLLYQVIGRVGRGHGHGLVVIQSFQPDNPVIKAAISREWSAFYEYILKQRRSFGFPPFYYLAQLVCKRASAQSADKAASQLKQELELMKLAIKVIGPMQPFYSRKGANYYCQLVVKAKDRSKLLEILPAIPAGWQVNLDPSDLL